MNHMNEGPYFQMLGAGSGPGPAVASESNTSNIGLGLHSVLRDEPLTSYTRNDFTSLRAPEQMDDHRSYYAQSICTQHSPGHDNTQRPPSLPDNAEDSLNFLPPTEQYKLLDEWSQPVGILLSAQLAGLFSRETSPGPDMVAPDDTNVAPEQLNLICYRRNLISITGHVAIPSKLRLVETTQGQQIPIVSQEIVLSVFESLERGRGGRLIQSLRSGPPISAAAEADSDSPGPEPITLDPERAEDASQDQEYVIFPFEWQRLQFRKATPNNGKSRDRQKFFFVSIKVLANLSDGQKVSISEVASNPIIVRGRGPQNFVAKDSQKLGRSRSLNSTNEGRLKKPNRHSTRNSLLRQSLSRKARLDSSGSSEALQRMSIEDLSELFRENGSPDVRLYHATSSPYQEMQMERTPPRDTTAGPGAPWAQLDLGRSTSIPAAFETNHSSDLPMMMDPASAEAAGWSPESTDYAMPHITSVSPRDIEKNMASSPISPIKSGTLRSSSCGAEQRYRPFLERQNASRDEPPRFVESNVFQAYTHKPKSEQDFKTSSDHEFPMSPPADDNIRRRSVSVSAPNTAFQESKMTEEKLVNGFPITPMSPPKEADISGSQSLNTDSISTPVSDFKDHDPLPSPATQFDIFESLLGSYSSVQGVDHWSHHSKIMTPIDEGLETPGLMGMANQFDSHTIPPISEPNEPPRIISFAEQFDSKPLDQVEIVRVPPPTEQAEGYVRPAQKRRIRT